MLVPPGEGDATTDTKERSVRIKAGTPELALTESRYEAGERGPERHVHREHCDCFWVLEGEVTFELGPSAEKRLSAGGFALVPPGVVHTFQNDGPAPARYLNIHAPSRNFHGYLRAMRDGVDEDEAAASQGFDVFDPPPDGGRPATDAHIVAPGAGEVAALGPSQAVFKAGAEHSDGPMSLTETTIGAGFPGPVAHYHESMVDSFYVLEGTLTLRLEDLTVEAGPGTYALIPPGRVHTFSNPSERPVRVLNLMAPGGFEQYLKEVASTLRPDQPPDPAAMARIAAKYDFHPVA